MGFMLGGFDDQKVSMFSKMAPPAIIFSMAPMVVLGPTCHTQSHTQMWKARFGSMDIKEGVTLLVVSLNHTKKHQILPGASPGGFKFISWMFLDHPGWDHIHDRECCMAGCQLVSTETAGEFELETLGFTL